MVNDLPQVRLFYNEELSLTKSVFTKPELPVTVLFISIKGFVDFFFFEDVTLCWR